MANANIYRFSDFTHSNYAQLLRLAFERFQFAAYDDIPVDGQFILWRHDLDFSIDDALPLARIEASVGIRATYFVNLRDSFYNAFDARHAPMIRQIADMGHAIGLHFDASLLDCHDEALLTAKLMADKVILESQFDVPVAAFSFHNPRDKELNLDDWQYAGMVNTYARRFRDVLGYCSDSNGYWRHASLHEVLKGEVRAGLQVLTHPCWWTAEIMSPRQKIANIIDRTAERMRSDYDQALASFGRKNIDW